MSERDDVKPWVSAALEEYKVHRAAYLEGLASAQRTLALGITAVGILVAGAFNVWDSSDPLPATLLFLVAIPLVCALVVLQWAGQMLFLVLRHRYLLALESTLRNAYPSGPTTLFTWEDLWAEYFGRRHQGSIRGAVTPITLLFGGAGPPLAGYVRDAVGSYDPVWYVAVGLMGTYYSDIVEANMGLGLFHSRAACRVKGILDS